MTWDQFRQLFDTLKISFHEDDEEVAIEGDVTRAQFESFMESISQKWTDDVPTIEGWYFHRDKKPDGFDAPSIVYVRDYAGKMAVGNSRLIPDWVGDMWIGPITIPKT